MNVENAAKSLKNISSVLKLEQIKKQFSEDVCKTNRIGVNSICQNQPPETTNLMKACLSCRLRETCKILYVEGR